ncbi:keywimysin-related RiPP [Streptomyces sp. NPDC050433]
MNEETTTYEAPALVPAGDFAEVTLGPTGRGFEWDWRCFAACNPDGS